MTSMRNRMHIVLWFLLIMFLLSMSIGGLVGGANILDIIFGRVNPQDAIGVVNGTSISPDDFNRAVNLRIDQYRANGQELNDQLYFKIRNEVWDNYIQDILINQQIEDMDLTATDEEVLFHLKNQPPAFLLQEEVFKTDGVFDQKKYEQAINNPQGNEWIQIEQFMKNIYIPNYKLQQYISSGVVVTHDEVYKQYISENVLYTIEGVHVLGQRMKDDVPEPTDEELQQAYDADLKSFKKDETRSVRYVVWKKLPAKSDTLRVYNEALDLINKSKSEDFVTLANLYSQDPGNQVNPDSGRGGDLGWFGKGQMVKPFEDAVFTTKPGKVVGPILTNFGYHIIKVHEKRKNNDRDEAHASHILLNITMGSQAREELRRTATRFSFDANDYGFEATLDTHQVTAQSAGDLTALTFSINGLGFMRSMVQFAFNDQTKIDQVSDLLENDNFYAVAILDSISPEGSKSFNEVKEELSRKLISEKQKNAALNLANEIRVKIDNGTSLTDLVSDDSRLELMPKDEKKLSRGFNSIGKSHAVIGALVNSKVADVAGPLETARGYCVVRLLNVAAVDSADWKAKESAIYSQLLQTAQNEAYNNWLSDLKEDAKIIDNRKYYF